MKIIYNMVISLRLINSLKPSGYYMYHLLYHIKLCILPSECICVFRMVLTINSDCFTKQH
jgi:hypothetical protein